MEPRLLLRRNGGLTRRDFLLASCAAASAAAAATVVGGCDRASSSSSSGSSGGAGPSGVKEVLVPAGEFSMGAIEGDAHARFDEKPRHKVYVDAFHMDETEITNAQFRKFVEATGYVTSAEKAPDWEEMKKQLPPGTPKPPADVLVPGSIVFHNPGVPVPLDNWGAWWRFERGANWRRPLGEGSSIDGKDDYPVVQVSWDDAAAYAKWAGKRLPTEAEWEWAARGGLSDQVYAWGAEDVAAGKPKANTFDGHFPDRDDGHDGFKGVAPVKRFAPNGYGLYDMAGNVWEWCADWYHPDYFAECEKQGLVRNPPGPKESFDPEEPTIPKRVQRGGSFLCHDSYCASYRASARMKTSADTALNHSGFRCVRSVAPTTTTTTGEKS